MICIQPPLDAVTLDVYSSHNDEMIIYWWYDMMKEFVWIVMIPYAPNLISANFPSTLSVKKQIKIIIKS